MGVRCPEDVSLIGVDDLDWADIFRVRPTLISQPIEEMTRMAISRLLEQVANASAPEQRQILFPPNLVERESCAPPGR
jgi:LacI family transcriptional regulator